MKGHHNLFLSVRNYKILIFLTVLVGLCLIYFQNSGVYHNKYLPLPREAMKKMSYSLQLHKYIIDQYYDYRKVREFNTLERKNNIKTIIFLYVSNS